MPPKAKGSSSDASAVALANGYAAIKGDKVLSDVGKPITKTEATVTIWSHALRGETQREEVLKAGVLPFVMLQLDRGEPQLKWASCGALHALAQSEKHMHEVITGKVILMAGALLSSSHDRAKQPAAQLLAHAAQRLEYSSKVADAALLPLLECCQPGVVSAWGGARITALHCLAALRALIETGIQGESTTAKANRRRQLMQAGAVPCLLDLLKYHPRLPSAALHPPAAGKKFGKSKGKGSSKAKATDRPPAGRKDKIATHAAACLRYLALCPSFQEEVLGTRHLSVAQEIQLYGPLGCGKVAALVSCLKGASAEQAAFVSGIIWELTADVQVAGQDKCLWASAQPTSRSVMKVTEYGGVSSLLQVIAANVSSAKGSKAKKKVKEAAAPAGNKKAERAVTSPAPAYPQIAVCNAAGALNHLTFLDTAKLQLVQAQGAPLLVQCLKLGHPQTFENATGALWNSGLHPDNTKSLVSAAAPSYLAHPVPATWLVATQPDLPPPVAKEPSAPSGPSFFITQGGSAQAITPGGRSG